MKGDPLLSFARGKNGHEVFDASELTVYAERPSAIAPTGTVKYVVGIRCPRCNTLNPPMQHGQYQECSECSLSMQLFGNGLECWV